MQVLRSRSELACRTSLFGGLPLGGGISVRCRCSSSSSSSSSSRSSSYGTTSRPTRNHEFPHFTHFGTQSSWNLSNMSLISPASSLFRLRTLYPSSLQIRKMPFSSTTTTTTSVETRPRSSHSIRLSAQAESGYSGFPLTSLNRIPQHSWDSHMHVVDPANYPLAANALYTPPSHVLAQAMRFESSVALGNVVLVQPSIYGNDNSCMLDALRELGSHRGRAVVTFDPEAIDVDTIKEWHALGVRGVRVNLKSIGRQVVEEELEQELKQYARVIEPFGWVLQLFIGLESMPWLEKIIPKLDVIVCIDHFGAPSIPKDFASRPDPYSLPGFQSLINLLRHGKTYVKLSAPYRLSTDGNQKDIEVLAQEILRVAGKTRVVYATDWPHTRFDDVDIKPFTQKCLQWCGSDQDMVERLFRGNAEDLWDVKR